MECLLCQRRIIIKYSLPWLLSWQPLVQPVVCEACWQGFVPIARGQACMGCGRSQTRVELCEDCQRWPLNTGFHNVALFDYNDAMQAYFHRYKFQGDYRLRRVFEKSMQVAVARLEKDLVFTIPVAPSTLATRGFNQVSGWLFDGNNQPGLQTKNQQKGIPQSQKDRRARLQMPQPFTLAPTTVVTGKRVLLVDDIYTTGRTIRHAATLLLESGAKSVTGLTLAR